MADDYDPNDPNDRDGTGEGFASEPIEHGPPPMGDEPEIGQSFVWMKAEPGKWGEQIEAIVDVLGPASYEHEKPVTWDVEYRGGFGEMASQCEIKREGDRWVRAD